MIRIRRNLPDLFAVLLLIFLWAIFFWRLYTPTLPDRLSISQGDFSGQYYNFSAYQAQRFNTGTLIPLWNPYNYAGSPFLADPQASAAYPVRWLFLWLYRGNWSYSSLEAEVMVHFLLTSLLMYLFGRRVTGRTIGGLIAAIAFTYGGYLSSFPVQQVTILESGTWLPVVLLGIYEGTNRKNYAWFVLAGIGMALVFLAGHPQVAMLCGYFAVAYLAWRSRSWREFLTGAVIFGLIGFGLAAVLLLPVAEFQQLTTRGADLNYVSKAGGYPFSDITQLIWSTMTDLYAPMYIGVLGIVLAAIAALFNRNREKLFWILAGLVALGIGFGGRTALFQFAYTLIPGVSLFRDQERAVMLWAFAVAMLAGFGAVQLFDMDALQQRYLRYGVLALAGITLVLLIGLHMIPNNADSVNQIAAYTVIIAVTVAVVLPWVAQQPQTRQAALVAVLVFDLFSVSQGGPAYSSASPINLLPEPPWITDLRPQLNADPFARIDAVKNPGLFGSLYAVPTIRGTSPLHLAGVDRLLNLPADKYWDLLAVRYVANQDEKVTMPPSAKKIQDVHDWSGDYGVYELDNPRPLATLIYSTDVIDNDDYAVQVMAAPDYDLRQRATVPQPFPIGLGNQRPPDANVELTNIAPEQLKLKASTSAPAMLLISIPYHPGWKVTANGQPISIVRADVGLMAIPLAPGQYDISLDFMPKSFQIGAVISLISLAVVVILGIVFLIRAITLGKEQVAKKLQQE